ncbi:type II secretion system F family protein [Shimia biformata]|uniref:type II secretion system F family protein n=1 Tax=Shimia biformata TaxID=1294299 RepID=UPI001951BF10|nr:type II secretion system F family protein [Shimia biformata]
MNIQFDTVDPQLYVYVGLGVGVLLAFSGLVQILGRGRSSSETKNRRLRLIAKGYSTPEVLSILKPKQQTGILSRLPIVGDLQSHIHRAGLRTTAERFLIICLLATVALWALLAGVIGGEQATVGAPLLGFIAPIIFVRLRSQKKSDMLVKQLPDALDMLSRGLKVGHPLNNTIGVIAQEMPDPISTEFGIVFDQVSYGDDLPEAFQEFAERVNLEDVHYLSASIGIQYGTGGDLANVIEVLSKTVRDRISMRKRIRAISSEGRLSALFLSALPFVIFGFTSYMTPSYYGGVASDPLFKPMAATVVILTLVTMLTLKKLVEFRV